MKIKCLQRLFGELQGITVGFVETLQRNPAHWATVLSERQLIIVPMCWRWSAGRDTTAAYPRGSSLRPMTRTPCGWGSTSAVLTQICPSSGWTWETCFRPAGTAFRLRYASWSTRKTPRVAAINSCWKILCLMMPKNEQVCNMAKLYFTNQANKNVKSVQVYQPAILLCPVHKIPTI